MLLSFKTLHLLRRLLEAQGNRGIRYKIFQAFDFMIINTLSPPYPRSLTMPAMIPGT